MKHTFLVCLLFVATSAFAQFGGMPMFGFGFGMSPEMMEAAKKDFEKNQPLADQGDAEAQAIVAKAYLTGMGASRNAKKGEKYARLSAEQGNVEGAVQLIRALADKKDQAKVVEALNKYIVPSEANQIDFIKRDQPMERFVRTSMTYYIDATYKNADISKLMSSNPEKVEFIKRWNTRGIEEQPAPAEEEKAEEVVEEKADTVAAPKKKVNIGPVENDEGIYTNPEQMAQYPGGDQALYDFIYENMEYPEKAIEQGIQGRVTVKMVIDEEGEVVNIEIIRSPSNDLSIAAIRIILAMQPWQPAMQDGKAVKSYFSMPISFHLPEEPAAEQTAEPATEQKAQ